LTDGQERPVLARVGLKAPCNADDFFLRWCKEKVFPEDRELYVQETNTRQMLEAYERGENELVIEFEAEGPNGQPIVLRRTILLTRDESNGDILALINAKDITEARRKDKEAREALLDAYEAADRASCAKTDFLSKMSHDIRTPMNAIIGMTAIAGTKLHDPESVAECLNKISGASRYLLSLINEVLDMSRIESGTMALQEENFDLIDMINNLEKVLSASAREKRQNITVRTHDIQNPNVMGDILRIQQAFMNVAQNAIMYTPEEGEISIEVTEKPSTQYQIGCYEFVFKDNGIGMSPEFLKRIYKPFERAEDVRVSKVQGTGLGLTISRNIIHMMDGDIEIESELGVGTIVTITLPLKHQEPGSTEDIDLTGYTVLVVDDEPFTCETTCMLLEKLGMQGEWVLSGEEALEYVLRKQEKQEELFAILLDCNMPGGLSGMETAKAIRSQARSNVPIVMFSAYDWADVEMEAQVAGIDAFIMKPLDEGRLVNVFKRFIHREKEPSLEHTLNQIEAADYSHKRILVVEDNDLNREIAMEILSMSGAQVETAENGQEAVEMVKASS
ncbi:MAG: response regulator, partial [Lachnospiraceae bacterium]|nr:response regulator [Lachnospiraceae bacterium]